MDGPLVTVLYHYTTSTALQSILDSNQLWPSLRTTRPRDVRYGEGQYLTDVAPGQLTGPRLSRLLIGNPFEGHRFTHFLAVEVTGLTIRQRRPGIFVIPNSDSLPLQVESLAQEGTSMTYLKVEWIHNFAQEPVEILSELDSDRNEIRKVERFRDGTLQFAGPEGASGSTMLSECPFPDLNEIAADPQFRPQPIGKDAFEHCWQTATMSVAA